MPVLDLPPDDLQRSFHLGSSAPVALSLALPWRPQLSESATVLLNCVHRSATSLGTLSDQMRSLSAAPKESATMPGAVLGSEGTSPMSCFGFASSSQLQRMRRDMSSTEPTTMRRDSLSRNPRIKLFWLNIPIPKESHWWDRYSAGGSILSLAGRACREEYRESEGRRVAAWNSDTSDGGCGKIKSKGNLRCAILC